MIIPSEEEMDEEIRCYRLEQRVTVLEQRVTVLESGIRDALEKCELVEAGPRLSAALRILQNLLPRSECSNGKPIGSAAAAELNIKAPGSSSHAERLSKAFESMTRDFRCAECGEMMTDHVHVTRCVCGESWTGPPIRTLVESIG